MLKTAIKGLLAHKLRLVATALAVMLGVSFMAGTLVLTDTLGHTFDKLFADAYRGTDAVVRAKAAFDGPQQSGHQRARVDASLVDRVRGVDGVAAAEGEVFGYARIVGKDGDPLGNPANGAPTVGANWSTVPALQVWGLAEGRGPTAADEMVIDKKSADDGRFVLGDRATVLTAGPPQQFRITGIATFGGADSPAGATFALFRQDVAQRLAAAPGKFDSISVVAAKGVSQTELTARIGKVLPTGTETLTGKAITKETQSDARKAMSIFNTFMLVFALVALFVGAFMIFNTFSITVAQRTRENGLLRALGASRRQVLSSVLVEAVVVGIVASGVGLGAGILVAGGLKALIAAIMFDVPGKGVVFGLRTAVVSIGAGMLVTLVAAVSPARKASKVAPIAAMHDVHVGSTGYGSKQRIMVGTGILAVGVGALFYGLFGGPSSPLEIIGLGVVLTFFAVSVLGRTVSLPLSRVIGWPMAKLRGVPGGLARENAMRNPKRTATSAAALMVGVGLVTFITVLASSTKASFNAAIDRSFTGDFGIESGAGSNGGLDPHLAERIAKLPEVRSATALRLAVAQVNGKVMFLPALDPKAGLDIFDVRPVAGSRDDMGAGAIAVQKDEAKDKHLAIGDTVSVRFKDGAVRPLRVAMLYAEKRPAGPYVISKAAYEANLPERLDFQVYIKRAPGTTTAQALAAIKTVTRDYPGVDVMDQTQIKAAQGKQVDQMLSLVYAMLALAIVIALLGIGNTLALSIFERTRELGLLRAVGMTRSQLRSSVRWESVIIALQGTTLGLGIGLFFGWALVRALVDQGIDRYQIPVVNLAVVVVLAGLAGVLAAVMPSRRAAKLNVLRAITSE